MVEVSTLPQILMRMEKLKSEMAALESVISSHPFGESIEYIMKLSWYERRSDHLREVIRDRDWPMAREEIEQVFKFSGFEYTSIDIDQTYPDSDEAVNSYRQEEISDYNSIFG